MPKPSRTVRPFQISRSQLEILNRVAGEDRLDAPACGDDPAVIEMWRNGLLRMNGGSGDSNSGDRPAAMKVGFDGALSMGADDVSGVLIVSAQKGIFNAS